MAVTTPRVLRLETLPTPLTEAPRLAAALGLAGRLLVKRDDLTGFAVAGNKARALEPLLADAVAQRATVLVTGGAPTSNFCQAATAGAAVAGLRCVLVLAGDDPGPRAHPNLAAARSWGAEVRWTGRVERASVDAALPQVAAELAAAGERPYVVGRGGATPLGATGFAAAADELAAQLSADPAVVVLAVGSGGSVAGLLAGTVARGRPWRVAGASVSRPLEEAAARVLDLARGCAALLGSAAPTADDVVLCDARGPGHGVPSAEGERAAALALRCEGLVLDPVYTAKALAALPALLAERRADPALTTVFWHTGGLLDAVAAWESR